jgi:CheY-like chemotaxis protein
MRLLWIDDEKDVLQLCSMILGNLGYKVFTSNTCTNMFDLVREAQPDIILLDNRMPGLTGIEATQQLKNSEFKNIPVVICSANPEAKEQAKKAGAAEFITKPFLIKDIEHTVKELKRSAA